MAIESILFNEGDYIFKDGIIVRGNTLVAEIYIRLSTPLGSYIYDTNLGNDLLNKEYIPSTKEIINDLENALLPMRQQSLITNTIISVRVATRSMYSALIKTTDNTGAQVQFQWRYLGKGLPYGN